MKRPSKAFTLLELLVVMSIIILLTAVSIPALKGMMKGQKLRHGAGLVQGALLQARSKAIATRSVYTVDFVGVNTAGNTYAGGRIYIQDAADNFVGKPIELPELIEFVFNDSNLFRTITPLPTYTSSVTYVAADDNWETGTDSESSNFPDMAFGPDGRALDSSTKNLIRLRDQEGNYITVQVRTTTGQTLVYYGDAP